MSCKELGVDPQTVSEKLQIGTSGFTNPLQRFECDHVLDMLSFAIEATGTKHIGLLAGKNFRPSTFLDVGHAFVSANSLRHALAVNAKYQRLTQQFGTTRLRVDPDAARVLWTPYIQDAERLRPITEAVYAGYVSIGRWMLWHYEEDALTVRFRHSRPSNPDPCVEYFGCDIYYDQPFDCLEFKADLADAKNPQANPELLKTLEARLDTALANLDNIDRMTNQVHQYVLFMLGKAPVSLSIVSEQLGLSSSKLSRILKDEGTSFRDILKDVRKQSADFHLKQGQASLAQIALSLGYSDQSAFTRAYREWHGHPPSHDA